MIENPDGTYPSLSFPNFLTNITQPSNEPRRQLSRYEKMASRILCSATQEETPRGSPDKILLLPLSCRSKKSRLSSIPFLLRTNFILIFFLRNSSNSMRRIGAPKSWSHLVQLKL